MADQSKTGIFSCDLVELEGLWEMTRFWSNYRKKEGLEGAGRSLG